MRHLDLKLLVAFVIFLSAFPSFSRADVITPKDTVTGTVIGKNKEPIPGAKVEIVGQPYSVFTDIDGHFNIKCEPGAKKVSVSYPKVPTVKKKISPDMTVRLGRSWKQVPENYQTFFGVNVGVGYTYTELYLPDYSNSVLSGPSYPSYNDKYWYEEDFYAPSLSFMVGRVKAVGWYFKGFYIFPSKGKYYDFSNKAKSAGGILGFMVRLGCPLHLYLGGGFGYTDLGDFWELESLYNTSLDLYNLWSWQLDMGLLFRIKENYGINLSMNLGTAKRGDVGPASFLNLGFVYFLNKK